jgi:hypothetical protein
VVGDAADCAWTAADIERLVREFIDCTLPKAQWTHEAHLRVGLWHGLRYPQDASLNLLRQRIRAYNESVGGINSPTAGYHETITHFYVAVIERFLCGVDRRRPVDELAAELIARFGARDLPLRHYSHALLFSTDARLYWREPDLAPLPAP